MICFLLSWKSWVSNVLSVLLLLTDMSKPDCPGQLCLTGTRREVACLFENEIDLNLRESQSILPASAALRVGAGKAVGQHLLSEQNASVAGCCPAKPSVQLSSPLHSCRDAGAGFHQSPGPQIDAGEHPLNCIISVGLGLPLYWHHPASCGHWHGDHHEPSWSPKCSQSWGSWNPHQGAALIRETEGSCYFLWLLTAIANVGLRLGVEAVLAVGLASWRVCGHCFFWLFSSWVHPFLE